MVPVFGSLIYVYACMNICIKEPHTRLSCQMVPVLGFLIYLYIYVATQNRDHLAAYFCVRVIT